MRMNSLRTAGMAVVVCLAAVQVHAQYDPPTGYYNSATGTGVTLKNQLYSIMASGHNQQTYGDFRYNASDYDRDPNNASRILLVYNRQSVPGAWDCSGGCVWNREHVWPQSLQPGSASNSSRGNLGDPFALRPCDEGINGARGNKPFGTYSSTGSYGSAGSYYFPGDADKGDIARSLFYSATRYKDSLTLVYGYPGTDQMGDLQALLRWHYTDPPDDFELRRNHVIYGYTNNRNAYIDRPEFAWSVYGGGANDSTLYVGGSAAGDGSSVVTFDLGEVIVGAATPAGGNVTLHKSGADPTYYHVTTSGGATSSVTGRYNAFDHGTQNRNIAVGLSASTATPGLRQGIVAIDNLDVSSGGAGEGAADGDDEIVLELVVLDHAAPSFEAGASVVSKTIDFGTVFANSGVAQIPFTIHNRESTPGWTAGLDLDGVSAAGDVDVFATDLAPQAGVPAGGQRDFTATLDTSGEPGVVSATFTVQTSDVNLAGAAARPALVLTLTAELVGATPIFPFDDFGDGVVDLEDFARFVDCFSGTVQTVTPPCDNHDADADGDVDLDDFRLFQQAVEN